MSDANKWAAFADDELDLVEDRALGYGRIVIDPYTRQIAANIVERVEAMKRAHEAERAEKGEA